MRALLTWHSIDGSGSPISVSPDSFRAQIEWIARAGIRVVSVPELLTLDDQTDAAALTFDDGFLNFKDCALPLLRAFGFSATVFVVGDHVGGDNRWRGREDSGIPVLPLLGWDDLEVSRATGMTIAAHTRTHAHLPQLDDAAIRDELASSADLIERRLGARPDGFAYPYGEVDPRVESLAAAHYGWACTTEYRALGPTDRATLLPRLDAWYLTRPSDLARWGTPHFRAAVWCRRQARRVRVAFRPRSTT